MKTHRLVAVHLLNDLSGSPFVLRQSLTALQEEGWEVHLFTATPAGRGFLTGMEAVRYHVLPYRWSSNRLVTLMRYVWNQWRLMVVLLFFLRRSDMVYVNSLLPYGAAIAAYLRGVPVVYHIHEVSIRPVLLKRWLLWVVRRTSSHCMYVSAYVRQQLALPGASTVVHNSLPAGFIEAARHHTPSVRPFTVLMLCSLKVYKGVWEFVALAREVPEQCFELVLNADQPAINRFFQGVVLPSNLFLHPAQYVVAPFYRRASVVMNASLPDQWIETFGMTILEAMCYRLPVIAPTVGGITELVEEGVNGFLHESRDVKGLASLVRRLQSDPVLYDRLSAAAYRKSICFSPLLFKERVLSVFADRPVFIPPI